MSDYYWWPGELGMVGTRRCDKHLRYFPDGTLCPVCQDEAEQAAQRFAEAQQARAAAVVEEYQERLAMYGMGS